MLLLLLEAQLSRRQDNSTTAERDLRTTLFSAAVAALSLAVLVSGVSSRDVLAPGPHSGINTHPAYG